MSSPTVPEENLSLRGLIHDLNNVFQTLMDAADLLGADPKWQKMAGTIHRSTERGQRLVQGITQASIASFDLAIIAEIAVNFGHDFLSVTHRPPMEVQVNIPAGMRLRGNPVEWERVLVNLLINAAEAICSNGRVELTAQRGDDGIRIRVANNGPAIAEGVLPRIFEPHFSTKPANGGLGLHIVRSIVEANGGEVTARNCSEGGVEFLIRVPQAG